MNLDDLVRGSDPARGQPDRTDHGLLDRVLAAGPARSSTGVVTAAVAAAAVTALVLVAVIGGLGRGRDEGAVPAGTASPAPTAAPTPADCLALVRGWRPGYLPAGFILDGKEQVQSKQFRQQQYTRRGTTQPTTATYLTVGRNCTDPSVQPSGVVVSRVPPLSTPPPQLTVRGHPAYLTDYGDLIRIDWDEEPNLALDLMTASDVNDRSKLLTVAELVRIANGLVHEKTRAEPTVPPATCPGLMSYRARTLPPGYRPGRVIAGGQDNLTLTYVKGTGTRSVTVTVVLTCKAVIADDPAKGRDRVTVHGKEAYVTRSGTEPVQVLWKEGPVEFWVIVGAEGPDEPQPTRTDVLTLAAGLRR